MDLYTVDHHDFETVRERGWQGNTRRVVTNHIRAMIGSALSLTMRVDQARFPEPAPGGEVEGAHNALLCMERAANLLRHAAAELDDERLRLRDGWPS